MNEAEQLVESIKKDTRNQKRKSLKFNYIIILILIVLTFLFAFLYFNQLSKTDELGIKAFQFGAYTLNNQIGELVKNCKIIPIKYENIVYNVTSLHCLNKIGG